MHTTRSIWETVECLLIVNSYGIYNYIMHSFYNWLDNWKTLNGFI